MKKLILILAILVGSFSIASAQEVLPYTSVSVGVQKDVFFQEFEVGGTVGKNQFTVVAETFNRGNRNGNRQLFAGIKYGKNFTIVNDINFQPSLAGKVRLSDGPQVLVIEPGVALQFKFSDAVGLTTAFSNPITERTLLNSPFSFKAGVGLFYNF